MAVIPGLTRDPAGLVGEKKKRKRKRKKKRKKKKRDPGSSPG